MINSGVHTLERKVKAGRGSGAVWEGRKKSCEVGHLERNDGDLEGKRKEGLGLKMK